jgi:hypothetical protein
MYQNITFVDSENRKEQKINPQNTNSEEKTLESMEKFGENKETSCLSSNDQYPKP